MAYEHKEYPKWVINQAGQRIIVKDKEEEDKLTIKKVEKEPKKPKGGW